MGIFAATRKVSQTGPEARKDLPERLRARLPRRFEAVGEALASGSGSLDAFAVTGRSLAQDGAALHEVLSDLQATTVAVARRDPTYDEVQTLSVAWSEATLAYLHQLSCEDPLTGMASLGHLRGRLSELYRGRGATLPESHALVCLDLPYDRPSAGSDALARTMRLTRLGECARTVFPGEETIARVGANRIVVLATRDERLGRRVALLRTLVAGDAPTRIWIEGLPVSDQGASFLLDELARP